MAIYDVKIESYQTGDRHSIQVQAHDKQQAWINGEMFGTVIEVRAAYNSDHWSVCMYDGYTVEQYG